jgi:hypothetical protein
MEDFVSHSGIKRMGDWGGIVQYGGGDSTMVVMFYMKPVQNPGKSAEAGRPYFDDKIYVRIHPPGERLNIIDREANEQDKRRFPMQWVQFNENRPQLSDGTPIDMLFSHSPAIAAALKASGVHTVEQCAKLSAHAIEQIGMGAQQWSNDAQRYLEVANKGVKASQLKAALDEKDRKIHSLEHTVELLQAELSNIRERQNQAVTMEDVQQIIANQGGGQGKRAQFAPGKQLSRSFDSQTAQINANHITRDISKSKAQKKTVSSKRVRVRLGD